MIKCPTCGRGFRPKTNWAKLLDEVSITQQPPRSRYGPDMVRIARQIAARKEHGITFLELLAINLGDLAERDLHQTVIPKLIESGQVHKTKDKFGTTRYHIGPGEEVKPDGIPEENHRR